MQKLTIRFHLILAALLCGVGPTAGADFEQGLAAFDRGNYAQALRAWETAYPAMDDADAARAAFSLGWLYQKGAGVTQNTQKAMDWYQRAAAKGSAEARHMLGLMSATSPPNRAVGEVFRDVLKDGGEGPEMVVLPTGRFRMGSPAGEADRDRDEGPVRTVTISKRIAMGRYEVTFADYDRFVAATNGRRPDDEGWGRGSRPVINVSQEDAKAYATWLSAQTGKPYRLPSEAEWEYAARAGTRTRYSWGDEINCRQARYGRIPGGECGYTGDGTVAVGSFEPNAFGLFDMHGNVEEWVKDCYVNTYTGAPSDGSARTSGCGANVRAVVRGGSWTDDPGPQSLFAPDNDGWGLSAANRYRNWPSLRIFNLGFRLVQDLNP